MKIPQSDKSMRDTVIRELEWDTSVDAGRIGVSATDGAVVLSGHVPAYYEKLAAVRAAERVYGVRAVADEIEVMLPDANVRDDADLAEEIARRVRWSTIISKAVKAEVEGGHVTLVGEVQHSFQRATAEREIRYLAGVHAVNNRITVRSHEPRPADVERRIGDAIERMADLDARSIWVTTSDGTVHLHGTVHSIAERHAAARAAASTPGVSHVDNTILVRP